MISNVGFRCLRYKYNYKTRSVLTARTHSLELCCRTGTLVTPLFSRSVLYQLGKVVLPFSTGCKEHGGVQDRAWFSSSEC